MAFQSRYFSAVGTWDNPSNPEITDDTQNRIIAITATKTEIIIGRNGTGTLAVTYTIQITLNDSSLTESGLERPIGFIDNISTKEFVLKNFSEIDSGNNTYYWFSVGA